MISYLWFIFAFFALFSAASSFAAKLEGKASHAIVVDPSGKGGFRTIQAAINSIPSNNKIWTTIEIKKGIYREKVNIPLDKPYIYLKGAGRENTIIEGHNHGPIDRSAVLTSKADHIMARGLTFNNSYNAPPNANPNLVDHRAVAARIKGDRSAFYKCRFLGFQDTLWDAQGRHYFKSSTIVGAVDFIFSDGQSIYEGCTISVAAGALGNLGYITAQGRENPKEFGIMLECYFTTQKCRTLLPLKVGKFGIAPAMRQLTLAEYNSYGPGAKSSERVKWAKKLNAREAKKLANISFVDYKEGWVSQSLSLLGGA